jgi:uncharacterized membrane protein YedE/YeeE
MLELLSRPWPWYVAGPLLGLFAPLLLLLGNKLFGISSNLRHACAAVLPGDIAYFRYDWRGEGRWNLVFALGILVGAFLTRCSRTRTATQPTRSCTESSTRAGSVFRRRPSLRNSAGKGGGDLLVPDSGDVPLSGFPHVSESSQQRFP